jgi:hypothetical protein
MLNLDPDLTAIIAVGAAVLSVLLLVVVLLLSVRLRSLRRDHRRAFQGVDSDVIVALGRQATEIGGLRDEVGSLRADAGHVRELLRSTVSRVGVVRYDAFDDMGGALSFSAALLDERGDGLVVSAINGRSETRVYAKPIAEGRSLHNLSNEETAALAAAIDGPRPASVPPEGARRRRRAS